MMELIELREGLEKTKLKKSTLEEEYLNLSKELDLIRNELGELENIHLLFQESIKLMYSTLSSKLGDIVTEGLSIVFPSDGYTFKIDFESKRNTIEAYPKIVTKDGAEFTKLTKEVGGGVVDFISILLKITFIILSDYDNILIADEPIKFIDRESIVEATSFLRKVSEDFKFQLLVITHIPEIVHESELVYLVEKIKGVSTIKKVAL